MTSDAEKTTGTGPQTVTAAQGSQPTIAGLRIGIVDAATRAGVSKARLLLRPASGDRAVTVTVGETVDVPGFGAVTLDAVEGGVAPATETETETATETEAQTDADAGAPDARADRHSGTAGRSSAERPRVRLTVTPTA